MVDVVVFLPLSLVSGIVGQIIRQYALVVVGSTLTSLFVSFTITPTLASRFAKLERLTDRTLLGKFALAFERYYHSFPISIKDCLNGRLVNKAKVGIGGPQRLFDLYHAACFPVFGIDWQ